MSCFIERMKPVCRNLHLFVFPSRINRVRYLAESAVNLLITFTIIIILGVLLFITNLLFGSFSTKIYNIDIEIIILCLPVIGLVINQAILTIKRLHDINLKGWWSLLIFIPYIGTFFQFSAFIIPGTKGDNRFGAEPKEATKAEWFLAIMNIFIVVAGCILLASFPE